MARRRSPTRSNPLYEAPPGKGAVEKSWAEVRRAIVSTKGKPPTCAVQIESIDTWTFNVTVWFAEYDAEITDLQERFEAISDDAFAVVRDGDFKVRLVRVDETETGDGSIDDVVQEIEDHLEQAGLSQHAESVALIDGVYVDWNEAISMADEGRTIVLQSARTAFASVWADAVEEAGRTQELIGAGNDIMNIAPPMNDESIRWAQEMWFRVAQANRGRTIPDGTAREKTRMRELAGFGISGTMPTWGAGACWDFVEKAVLDGPESPHEDAERELAFATAMQAMGHGVSWQDNYPEHGLKIPHFDTNFIVVVPRLRRIRIAYQIVTPESAEDGDYADQGWENEEGELIEPDEQDFEDSGLFPSGEPRAYADRAYDFLTDEIDGSIVEYSSSPGDGVGGWYTGDADENFQTGEETTYTYHLVGFTEEEQRYIYNRLFEKDQLAHFTDVLKKHDPEGYKIRMQWAKAPAAVSKQTELSRLVSHLNYQIAYTSEAIAAALEPVHEFFADLYRRMYEGDQGDADG